MLHRIDRCLFNGVLFHKVLTIQNKEFDKLEYESASGTKTVLIKRLNKTVAAHAR